ncbi:selenoprotein, putative [Plasmodium ovale wallikeri]|uniref:Selenoprotein, putative n=2 Tax=Plasmodium ovale TaxID=36330 RepID=A0A1A8ZME2_PLAOA|nr:selenoprotein, putative [Plasmodium ovale wallikeri]SBT45856.1 selenoprotein, putative [Plasmodium ovale wallikeri]SBT78812.1 selenoprotein, putative [Plasmodium ovale]
MDKMENRELMKGVTVRMVKNVLMTIIAIALLIFIYKFMKYKRKISEYKRNREINEKMKMSREKKLQELEKEMIANKEKMKERVKKGEDEKKDKQSDASKQRPGSTDNSTFNHFRDYSNYYRPSIRNRYKNASS